MRKQSSGSSDGTATAKQTVSTPFDRYEVVTVHRSELKDAPYNPRQISDSERDKLKAGLRKHGLVAPLTWNVRTGHVVGGHQRLHSMDALAGSPDYSLKVSQVDVDETAEKELNILLNNPNAQGAWDLEKLEALLSVPELDLAGAGFDVADAYRLFGDLPGRPPSETNAMADALREIRNMYDKAAIKNKTAFDNDFYVVVVFRNSDHRTEFLAACNMDDNRYQDGRTLQALLGKGVQS